MKFLPILILIFASRLVTAQNFYEKIFYNQHGTACAREDSAGNIIVAFPEDSVIAKYDSVLNPLWTRTYDFHTYLFEVLPNGNWITGGHKFTGAGAVAHMAMLDPNGDTIWTRMPAAPLSYSISTGLMKMDHSGNLFYLTGLINNQWISPTSFYKYDIQGNLLGTYSGYFGINFHFNIIYNNRIITAYSDMYTGWLTVDQYDSSFNHLWTNYLLDTIGNPHTFNAGIVFPATNSNIVLGGNYDWYTDLFYLNSLGDLNTMDFCPVSGNFYDVIKVSSGGYLCIGKSWNTNKGFAVRYSSNFYTMWAVEFDGINGVYARFAQETHDGFIISGSTVDSSSNNIPWMTKIDFNGSMTTGINESKSNYKFQVNYSNHRLEIPHSSGNRLIIYDMNGRVFKTVDNLPDNYSEYFLPAPGIYLFSLYKDNVLLESRKILVN